MHVMLMKFRRWIDSWFETFICCASFGMFLICFCPYIRPKLRCNGFFSPFFSISSGNMWSFQFIRGFWMKMCPIFSCSYWNCFIFRIFENSTQFFFWYFIRVCIEISLFLPKWIFFHQRKTRTSSKKTT